MLLLEEQGNGKVADFVLSEIAAARWHEDDKQANALCSDTPELDAYPHKVRDHERKKRAYPAFALRRGVELLLCAAAEAGAFQLVQGRRGSLSTLP